MSNSKLPLAIVDEGGMVWENPQSYDQQCAYGRPLWTIAEVERYKREQAIMEANVSILPDNTLEDAEALDAAEQENIGELLFNAFTTGISNA